jgi:hypothetical protein
MIWINENLTVADGTEQEDRLPKLNGKPAHLKWMRTLRKYCHSWAIKANTSMSA